MRYIFETSIGWKYPWKLWVSICQDKWILSFETSICSGTKAQLVQHRVLWWRLINLHICWAKRIFEVIFLWRCISEFCHFVASSGNEMIDDGIQRVNAEQSVFYPINHIWVGILFSNWKSFSYGLDRPAWLVPCEFYGSSFNWNVQIVTEMFKRIFTNHFVTYKPQQEFEDITLTPNMLSKLALVPSLQNGCVCNFISGWLKNYYIIGHNNSFLWKELLNRNR